MLAPLVTNEKYIYILNNYSISINDLPMIGKLQNPYIYEYVISNLQSMNLFLK